MILIFDLDDTLYDEFSYVKSGFSAVAFHLTLSYRFNKKTIFNKLIKILKKNGRGRVFNILCKDLDIKKKKLPKELVQIYRSHKPIIKLRKETIQILNYFSTYKKYIITDGNYLVQSKKVRALKLKKFFKRFFYTNFYGKTYNKPSLYCFKKIKEIENVNWNDMVYIGDNPNKDFINCNKKKILTVRLMKGQYKKLKVHKAHDAKFKIKNLLLLRKIIN